MLIQKRFWAILFALLTSLMFQTVAFGQGTLVDVTATSGIDYVHNSTNTGTLPASMTGGAAAGDFDNDGYVDLFVTRIDNHDILYRNNGNGTFSDVTSTWFPESSSVRKTNGASWGDIDNDGDLDLYVTGWNDTSNYLFVNNGGGFSEQAVARGADVSSGSIRTGASPTFGDFDNDGYIDIYTTEWSNFQNRNHSRLLRNLGETAPGHFEDVTVAAGVDISGPVLTFAPRFTDLDRDGHVDLAVATDFTRTKLYWNNGDGTFTDGTDAAGIIHDRSAMGSALGDYDNDGDMDWFLGNIDIDGNQLYKNQLSEGTPRQFTNVANAEGVRQSEWSWGSSFFELDNDGNLDLIVTNGIEQAGYRDDGVFVFHNQGEGSPRFANVSDSVLQRRDTQIGSGLVIFDYDNDGDQDAFIVNGGINDSPVLYENQSDGGNFLQLSLTGKLSNKDALGAFITVIPDENSPENSLVWEVNAGSGFLGQNEMLAHFGLADTDVVDRIIIEWPSGITQSISDVSTNQRLLITEAVPEPEFAGIAGSLLIFLISVWRRVQRK